MGAYKKEKASCILQLAFDDITDGVPKHRMARRFPSQLLIFALFEALYKHEKSYAHDRREYRGDQ